MSAVNPRMMSFVAVDRVEGITGLGCRHKKDDRIVVLDSKPLQSTIPLLA